MKISFKDFIDSTAMVADKYRNHFANLSQKMGYPIKPDEWEINYFGYEALKAKHYKKAEGLFKLNVGNYPESFNVYDSYGDYFIAIGDKTNAAIQLKKALAIKENEGSRKKLEEIEGDEKVNKE